MNPNRYPQYWWHKLAHVCQRWRRIILDSPNRLGLTLVCTHRTPVEDLLAHSPAVPIAIYYGNPEPYDPQNDLESIRLALLQRDRVCRINLHLPSSSLSKVFNYMKGTFPVLETLQLYCSSLTNECARLPSTFNAPKLRHLQLSDFALVPQKTPPLNTTICPPSLVSFSLGEVVPVKYQSPALFVECLSVMPQLKSLKIGYLFPVEDKSRQQASHSTLRLTNLEELQFHGRSDYFEALAARITAPSLKKLSLTFTDLLEDVALPNLSVLIRGTTDLSESCKFARVRFKDNTSIVMDQNELWTGRGAFELMFSLVPMQISFETQLKTAIHVCGELPLASDVTSLLLEYARANQWSLSSPPTSYSTVGENRSESEKLDVYRKMWHGLLGPFKTVDTLRVAGHFVDELDNALKPDAGDGNSVRTLLPKLNRIVLYGPVKDFKPFVEARKRAGSEVMVESGPKNRLTLV